MEVIIPFTRWLMGDPFSGADKPERGELQKVIFRTLKRSATTGFVLL
jgi:hypothetical protein